MRLIELHDCRWSNGVLVRNQPVWINPEYVVAVYPRSNGESTCTTIRLHGDQSHQDWLIVIEEPDDVRAALLGMLRKGETPPRPFGDYEMVSRG